MGKHLKKSGKPKSINISTVYVHVYVAVTLWFKGPVLAVMLCMPVIVLVFKWGVYCLWVLFWQQTKASEFSTSQKMATMRL